MSLQLRNRMIGLVLIIFFAVEIYCVTYYRNSATGSHFLLMTILMTLVGAGAATLPLAIAPTAEVAKQNPLVNLTIIALFLLGISGYCLLTARQNFMSSHIDIMNADMIPQIKACCQRLLHGEQIYKPIPEIWGGMNPTYMPMMWLPWVPTEALNIDLRWTSVAFYLLGLAFLLLAFPTGKKRMTIPLLAIVCLLGYISYFIFQKDHFIIENVQEPIVFCYYLLLGYGLIKKNPWVTGFAIGCCLLSRYILVFWVPVYLVFTFLFESRKRAIIMASIAAAMVLVIFIIPFWIKQPEYFTNVIAYYHEAMHFHYQHNVDEHNKYAALGLGVYFQNGHLDLLTKIEMLAALLPAPIAFGLFYKLKDKLAAHKDFFGICSLKLTVVFFFLFVEIPYSYLFFTSALLTASIAVAALRKI